MVLILCVLVGGVGVGVSHKSKPEVQTCEIYYILLRSLAIISSSFEILLYSRVHSKETVV